MLLMPIDEAFFRSGAVEAVTAVAWVRFSESVVDRIRQATSF